MGDGHPLPLRGDGPPPPAPPFPTGGSITPHQERVLGADQQRYLLRTAMVAALAASLCFLWDPFGLFSAVAMLTGWYAIRRWTAMKASYRANIRPLARWLALGLAAVAGSAAFARLVWTFFVPVV